MLRLGNLRNMRNMGKDHQLIKGNLFRRFWGVFGEARFKRRRN